MKQRRLDVVYADSNDIWYISQCSTAAGDYRIWQHLRLTEVLAKIVAPAIIINVVDLAVLVNLGERGTARAGAMAASGHPTSTIISPMNWFWTGDVALNAELCNTSGVALRTRNVSSGIHFRWIHRRWTSD